MDRVLQLCKTSKLEIFRVKISNYVFPKSTLKKWISEAVKRNVCEIDVDVHRLDLPLSVFTCKTLTTFRLHFVPMHSRALRVYPSVVSLPCLKTLDIIVQSIPFRSVFKLIHGCPALEILSLKITNLRSAEDYYFEIPTLKRLTVVTMFSPVYIHKVVLNVPNLEYLYVVKNCPKSLFVIKDLSSLVEAKFSCTIEYSHLWVELLRGISGAKFLSLKLKVLNPWYPLSSPFTKFPNVKRLELIVYACDVSLLIPQILENCSELEHLCINKEIGDFWNKESHPVPNCMVTNLKTLTVIDIMGNKHEIRFLKFMLANLKVLKKLTMMFDEYVSVRRQRAWSRDLSMLPRASSDCQLHFDKEINSIRPFYM